MARTLAATLETLAVRIDTFTRQFGRAVALLGFATVIVCFASVYLRYAVGVGYTWVQELYTWTHVLLIMLGSAYTLLKGGFVRVDMLYARASDRARAWIDLLGALFFTLPFLAMVAWYGWPFFVQSWTYQESSVYSPASVPVWQIKALIPAAGVVLLLQGISEVIRCCRCIHTGQWPPRPHDVEETESAILHLHEDEARMGRELPLGTDEGARR